MFLGRTCLQHWVVDKSFIVTVYFLPGFVLDCIDSWSLHPYLLCCLMYIHPSLHPSIFPYVCLSILKNSLTLKPGTHDLQTKDSWCVCRRNMFQEIQGIFGVSWTVSSKIGHCWFSWNLSTLPLLHNFQGHHPIKTAISTHTISWAGGSTLNKLA